MRTGRGLRTAVCLSVIDPGLEKVELIKGPMNVLYGSEAVGGLINPIEAGRPELPDKVMDLFINIHSNTLGGIVQAGLQHHGASAWHRLLAGIENHADDSDGLTNQVELTLATN